jgi:hypothetical protein
MNKMLFKLAILCVTVGAFAAQDSLESKQISFLDKVTAIQENAFGLAFGGTAKGGYLSSVAQSDQMDSTTPTSETQAFSQMNLVVTARPSPESKATVEVRMHQDWQKAHEQGVNPLLLHWFSYDGRSLGKKLQFNIGDMRVAYTPLTINQPQGEQLQEPEVFKAKRLEAMAYKNLLDTNARLMQGLNADYHSGKISVIDDIHGQGTIARLRNNGKKPDQAFFDFDREDRYLLGGRFGLQTFGANIGANIADVSDRLKSSLNIQPMGIDTIRIDKNRVISFELGYNTKTLVPSKTFEVGANVEYALSKASLDKYFGESVIEQGTYVIQDAVVDPLTGATTDSTIYVGYLNSKTVVHTATAPVYSLDGKSLLANLTGRLNVGEFESKLVFDYLQNDEKFVSELASTPSFVGYSPILNSDAVTSADAVIGKFRSGSLENMYYSIYQSLPLQQTNLMGKVSAPLSTSPPESEIYRLDNNYKMGHFYRNGYTNMTYQASELAAVTADMDPSLDMALPLGYATPDLKGFQGKLDMVWNNQVTLNGRFGTFSQTVGLSSFTKMGAGIGADLAAIVGYGKALDLQGSFESTTESKGLERKSTRIVAGTKVGVWRGLSVLAGFQSLNMEYGTPLYGFLQKSAESLILAGTQVEITKGSTFSAQFGMLSNKLTYLTAASSVPVEFGIDKTLIAADVTVKF